MFDDQMIRLLFNVETGAKAKIVILALGRCINPAPLRTAERPLFIVTSDDILPQLGPDMLEPIAEMTDDGENAQNRMLALRDVVKSQSNERDEPQ